MTQEFRTNRRTGNAYPVFKIDRLLPARGRRSLEVERDMRGWFLSGRQGFGVTVSARDIPWLMRQVVVSGHFEVGAFPEVGLERPERRGELGTRVDALEAGGDLPPVVVDYQYDYEHSQVRDPKPFRGRYYLIDGWHRLAAYRQAGRKTIPGVLFNARGQRYFRTGERFEHGEP